MSHAADVRAALLALNSAKNEANNAVFSVAPRVAGNPEYEQLMRQMLKARNEIDSLWVRFCKWEPIGKQWSEK